MLKRKRTSFLGLSNHQRDIDDSFYYVVDLPRPMSDFDPRDEWCHSVGLSGKWATTDPWRGIRISARAEVIRTYWFEKEEDFILFKLRWEGVVID